RTVEEHDLARRIMYASRADHDLPKDYASGLLALHSRQPFPQSPEEIAESAAQVRDKNFRIEIAEDGIHIYNRDRHHIVQNVFDLYPRPDSEKDGALVFYLGVDLAKEETAGRLAKRYAQDEPLDWGVAADAPAEDRTRLKEAGHTLIAKKKQKAS